MRIILKLLIISLICYGSFIFTKKYYKKLKPEILQKTEAFQPAINEPLIEDPSFEISSSPDKSGKVFPKWGGWKYEGDAEFAVSEIAHEGKTSCLLKGISTPKIRISVSLKEIPAGRYRITGFMRGLNISEGNWKQTTEFSFNEKYFQLKKNGTFGWTKLTYVIDIENKKKVQGPSFGLMATGFLWIDDVNIEKVSENVEVTEKPILEESLPFTNQMAVPEDFIRCKECLLKNNKTSETCFACGEYLTDISNDAPGLPNIKLLNSFENKEDLKKISEGKRTNKHYTDGEYSLEIKKKYISWDAPQNWTGYDYLVFDTFTESPLPMNLYVEIRDSQTEDYWTRVNYNTVIKPLKDSVTLPLDMLYVGEKSRPGRKPDLKNITRFVVNIGENPSSSVFIDNIRLVQDEDTKKVKFENLYAFDFGTNTSPVMLGFYKITASSFYSPFSGFGFINPAIWRSYDVLQPDPLNQDFICVEKGTFAVDLPNGKYHVFLNMDNPSGYWGEYQKYKSRTVLIENKEVFNDAMDFEKFKDKYFKNYRNEDCFTDDMFEKYVETYYETKHELTEVTDGQLNIDFKGENWAISLASLIVYPEGAQENGKKFLQYVKNKRKFFFDNYFKIITPPKKETVPDIAHDENVNFAIFSTDYTDEIMSNYIPDPTEFTDTIKVSGFAGEFEPVQFSIYPFNDIEKIKMDLSDLKGENGIIKKTNIKTGYISERIKRITMEGTIYTIAPRWIMPFKNFDLKKGATKSFWISTYIPKDTKPGEYAGKIKIILKDNQETEINFTVKVFQGKLEELDIPAGPWGHSISIPWFESDAMTREWNDEITLKSLNLIKKSGFTSFSGIPHITYKGFKNSVPEFDFSLADKEMEQAKSAGFEMPIINYNRINGLDTYYPDQNAFKQSGCSDYSEFIKMIFNKIQKHADENKWLPVYWNLGDEPIGENLIKAIENAGQYKKAFSKGPPFFTAAFSINKGKESDKSFEFAKNLHMANLNLHSEKAISKLQDNGVDWAFYNNGNRWTYGIYMFKAVRNYNMKMRLSWHWNLVAGDPYYPLDCREDDYAWCNSSPDKELIPSLYFEREIREGLDDYRYIYTLWKLANLNHDLDALEMITEILDSFTLGETDIYKTFRKDYWKEYRSKMVKEIERLSSKDVARNVSTPNPGK